MTPYLRNQDGSVHVVLFILCDHTMMSQEHKTLPGTVVHLCFSRGKVGRRVVVYHEETQSDLQSAGNGTDKADRRCTG